MASSKNSKDKTKITRINASDDSTPKKTTKNKPAKTSEKIDKPSKKNTPKKPNKSFLKRLGEYFKGSWEELKKVQWPDRKATWSLTIAVILFTVFFVIFILLIDVIFQELFNIILSR